MLLNKLVTNRNQSQNQFIYNEKFKKSAFLSFPDHQRPGPDGSLHIVEEVTFRNDSTGNYKMTIDMSEIKSMMDALKDVGGDSTATDGSEEPVAEEPAEENSWPTWAKNSPAWPNRCAAWLAFPTFRK